MNPDQTRILKMEGHAKTLHNYLSMCADYDSYIANEPICSAYSVRRNRTTEVDVFGR